MRRELSAVIADIEAEGLREEMQTQAAQAQSQSQSQSQSSSQAQSQAQAQTQSQSSLQSQSAEESAAGEEEEKEEGEEDRGVYSWWGNGVRGSKRRRRLQAAPGSSSSGGGSSTGGGGSTPPAPGPAPVSPWQVPVGPTELVSASDYPSFCLVRIHNLLGFPFYTHRGPAGYNGYTKFEPRPCKCSDRTGNATHCNQFDLISGFVLFPSTDLRAIIQFALAVQKLGDLNDLVFNASFASLSFTNGQGNPTSPNYGVADYAKGTPQYTAFQLMQVRNEEWGGVVW
jgi:hypothetical protein